MKKKLLAFVLGVAILGTGMQAYAATVLNTNIIGLIQNMIHQITTPVIQDVDKDLKIVDYSKEINAYIDKKNDEYIKEIRKHEQSEVKRAQTEMDNYVKDVEKQIDSIYENEMANSKKEITGRVNEKVKKHQENVDRALENKLTRK